MSTATRTSRPSATSRLAPRSTSPRVQRRPPARPRIRAPSTRRRSTTTATSLKVSADTDNAGPTQAEASPKGEDPNSDKTKSASSNKPTQSASTTVDGTQALTTGGKLKVASTSGFVTPGTLHTDLGDCS